MLCWAGLGEGYVTATLFECRMNWGRRLEQLTERELVRLVEVVTEAHVDDLEVAA